MSGAPRTILLVEDASSIALPLAAALEREGYAFAGTRTTAAPSGSFRFERTLVAGVSPVIRARATRNGENCTATLIVRATAPAPAPVAPATGAKLRGDGTVDDDQAQAEDHHGGNSGSRSGRTDDGGNDDSGHRGRLV